MADVSVTRVGDMPASIWLPDAGAAPGIVVLQEIFGVTDYVRGRCNDLADLGYAVLAPEIYWRTGQGPIADDDPDALEDAMAAAGRVSWEDAVGDAVASMRHLREDPLVTDVGVLGLCFGGGLAFAAAAAADPAVLVSYYGSALPRLLGLADSVRCPSLHHFGTADDYLTPEHVRDITAAVTDQGRRSDVTVELYEGAGHAFDNPNPLFHHEAASRRAWQLTTDWLARELPVR